MALNVRSVASSTKQVLSSETASVRLATLTEQVSTVQACGSCRSGKVLCSKCQGSGEFGCGTCDARGKVKKQCSNCGGKGRLKCHSCHGSGNVTNHYQVLSSDGTRYNHEMRYERCSSCGGSGLDHYACAPCSGSGKVFERCSRCSGSGKVSCATCSGNGSLTCQSCQGHARTTTIYQVEPYVTTTRGQLRVAIQEVEDFIVGNLKLLMQDPHFSPSLAKFSGAKSSFYAEYHGTVPVGGIAVNAAGKTFEVYAIGPSLTWTTRPAFADALLGDLLAKLKATRSARLSDIPALVGNSEMGESLVQGGLAGNAKFAGKLLPGLSREMADGLQAEVTRLYKSAKRARLTRRVLIAAPFVAAGLGLAGWRFQIVRQEAAKRNAEMARINAELAAKAAEARKRITEAAAERLLRRIKAHDSRVTAVAFSPDGRMLVTGADYGTSIQSIATSLKLWDVKSGRDLGRFAQSANGVAMAAFSPDGKSVLVVHDRQVDDNLRVLDLASGRLLLSFTHAGIPEYAAFSRDGRLIASGGSSSGTDLLKGLCVVWEANTGRELIAFRGHNDRVNTLAFTPDSRRMLSGSGMLGIVTTPPDRTLRLWDIATGRETMDFGGYATPVGKIVIPRHGRTAFIAGDGPGGEARLRTPTSYDLSSGKLIKDFGRKSSPSWHGVEALALSPDERLVVAADSDAVTVWSASDARELVCLAGGWSKSLAIAPDGSTAVSGDSDGFLNFWDLRNL